MKLRIRREAPEDIFPIDDWKIVQNKFDQRYVAHEETIYALANGYLGTRGGFVEGRPAIDDGTLINGFFEFRPLAYPEEAFGFPRQGQTIIYVPEAKIIRLYVDDEPLDVSKSEILSFKRTLDMQAGILVREIEWRTPSGKRVSLKTTRLVSFTYRQLAAIEYELTLLEGEAHIDISSELINFQKKGSESADPRKAPLFAHKVLTSERASDEDLQLIHCYRTQLSNHWVACGVDHQLVTDCTYEKEVKSDEDFGGVSLMLDGIAGQSIRLTKYIVCHTEENSSAAELCHRAETTLTRAKNMGFSQLAREQRAYMDDFWKRSDVQLRGDHPRLQQVIRWNLFQLLQASGRVEGHSIPARGLTGRVYEGHYFWDAEIYEVPFLVYSAPNLAKHLLKHRFDHLEKARERARELSHNGALFPWRTINGEEASTYFLAGTAQYHINACIMYAVQKYVTATGDDDFLFDAGAEMYVETARFWLSLGCYPQRHPAKFCINGVTGPDEYTTMVNNNFFTNAMARENLLNAVKVVERMERERPQDYRDLVAEVGLEAAEITEWARAAESMYLPYDEELGIHPQDDSFLDKERLDISTIPVEKFPLMMHFHYLDIYRTQVIKQADTMMAMFLLGHQFSQEDKKRNFEYYDPITTGDLSLSACIQSILAAELGEYEKELKYFRFAAVMDLADVAGNVVDGAHLASIGGTWLALVYGFGGFRDFDGRFTFNPRLPPEWELLRFPLAIRGQTLDVNINKNGVTYTLMNGAGLSIEHRGEVIELTPNTAVTKV